MSAPLRCKHDVELFDCFECFPASNTVKHPVSLWDELWAWSDYMLIRDAVERGRKLEELLIAFKEFQRNPDVYEDVCAIAEELSK